MSNYDAQIIYRVAGAQRVAGVDANSNLQVTQGNAAPAVGVAGPGTAVQASASVAAAANNQTLAAAAGKFTYISGFAITGLGATGASTISVTITGIATTLTFAVTIPAGATTAITPLIVTFPVPIPGSAVNTAVVVNVPSFGSGNTNSTASAWGFQL